MNMKDDSGISPYTGVGAAVEPPTRGPLIINAIYRHYGRAMIAVTRNEMILLSDVGDTKYVANDATELLARPGSEDWIDHMVRIRNSLARDVAHERASLQQQKTYIENLGEAILEKAVEKEWCEEYDKFAEEWGLPLRFAEYDVTVTVRVRARDSEQAADLIRGELGFDSYHDDVIDGPEVTAEKAF